MKLDEREAYWIDYYNTYHGYGYNSAPGGEGAPHPVKLSESDVLNIMEMLKTSEKTIKQIAEQYGVSSKTISDINNGKSRINITQCDEYPIRKPGRHDEAKFKDLMLKYNGQVSLVAKEYGCTVQTIYGWMKGFGNTERARNTPTPVLQIDIQTGAIIHRYESMQQAARALHKSSNGTISNVANGRCKSAYGYYWQFDDN